MRIEALSLAVTALALGAAALAQEEDAPRGAGLLICYPNAPGNEQVAQPVMDQLGQYLSRHTESSLRPVYFNRLEPARAFLLAKRPAFGILSLDTYLRWRASEGLTVLALSERRGAAEERLHLLVAEDAPYQRLEDLANQGRTVCVWSSHLDDARFAANVVFERRLRVDREGQAPVLLVSTDQPLRALRRLKEGRPFEDKPVDAVVVDDTTWDGLQRLKTFQGVLRELHTSPPLPTPPVVAFPGAAPEQAQRLSQELAGMREDEEGQRILSTLQATGFRPADDAAMAQVIAAYEREVPE